jgi:hypothetical protein
LLLDENYNVIPEMLTLLKAIKDKYRIFITTKVDSDDKTSSSYKKAKDNL